MTFQDIFAQVQTSLSTVPAGKIPENFAVQVNITGEGAGSFYIANKDGTFAVEPYDYNDRDGSITLASETLLGIAEGASVELALAAGKIQIEGNPGALVPLFKEVKKTAKTEKKAAKTAAKTEKTEKKAEKKTEKKAEPKPTKTTAKTEPAAKPAAKAPALKPAAKPAKKPKK